MPKIRIPANMAKAGWDFEIDEINRLCDFLGITADIKFRYSSAETVVGTYRTSGIGHNFQHDIVVSQIRDIDDAMSIVIHELTHAAQLERFVNRGGKWMQWVAQDYRRNKGEHGQTYWNNKHEIEARKNGATLKTRFKVLY
jgi:hypothetical protein